MPSREAYPGLGQVTRTFANGWYAVLVSEEETAWGMVLHLWIRKMHGSTEIPWVDKQWIKDTLVGEERVAVEVFPACSALVDSANMYHLWVLPEGMTLPFSLLKDGT